MDLQRASLPRIDDAKLGEDAPAIRAEVLRRLEALWATLAPRITDVGTVDEFGDPVRLGPRFVEAGIRVLDRLMRLYRLDAPGVTAAEPLSGQDVGDRVARELAELESRWNRS